MAFEKILGQTRVKALLRKTVATGRASHAYLFLGERGVGKEATALEFAKGLLCAQKFDCANETCRDCSRIAKLSHPDLHFVFPAPAKPKEDDRQRILASVIENPYNRLEIWSNPSISIDQIRELRRTSSYKSFEGKGRVVVIADCERMTAEAANALLKILEEPPAGTYLILVSSRPNLLLPTIVSRCQEVKFDPLPSADIEEALLSQNLTEPNQARLVARMASGSYKRALALLDENLDEMQQTALEFLRKSVQNPYVQVQFVEELIQSFDRDLHKVKELLKLVANWLRDALVFRCTNGEQEDALINQNQLEALQNFNKSFGNADLHGSVMEIERALELMDRNVQINLILIVLLNKLRAYIRN